MAAYRDFKPWMICGRSVQTRWLPFWALWRLLCPVKRTPLFPQFQPRLSRVHRCSRRAITRTLTRDAKCFGCACRTAGFGHSSVRIRHCSIKFCWSAIGGTTSTVRSKYCSSPQIWSLKIIVRIPRIKKIVRRPNPKRWHFIGKLCINLHGQSLSRQK